MSVAHLEGFDRFVIWVARGFFFRKSYLRRTGKGKVKRM
jgi:hypothetical protein